MTAVVKFRVVVFLVAVFVGGTSLANFTAEFLRSAVPPFPTANVSPGAEQISSATLAAAIAPFRSDLVADRASALADQALKSQIKGPPEQANTAENAIKSAIRIRPHDSRMWLALALVQSHKNPADPLVAEALKMSYLTGPNQADLVSTRLAAVTANSALSDSDLGDLARSDVRALLTQLAAQRQTLTDDYARASAIGKKFLEESVSTIDPEFANQLRKK